MIEYTVKTPHRLSLVWWGTDVKDYYNQYWWISINFAIDLFSSCTIKDNSNWWIVLKSVDLKQKYKSDDLSWIYTDIDAFRLCKWVYERILKQFNKDWFSFEMITNSVVPVWSWLWWSSSMTISILKAFLKYLGIEYTKEILWDLAYQIEREDLWIKWWVQDQLCATYCWFNVYYLSNEWIKISPLNYPPLTHWLVLVYTWISRDWSILMNQSESKVKSWSEEKINSLNRTKEKAIHFLEMMKIWDSKWIHETINNSRMNKISTIDEDKKEIIMKIYNTWLDNWANSWRLLWAWNWGFMVFFCDENKVNNVWNSIKKQVSQTEIFYPKMVEKID